MPPHFLHRWSQSLRRPDCRQQGQFLWDDTPRRSAPGYGTAFKLSASGIYTVLHYFTYSTGALPYAGLYADSRGNLYGTTNAGGAYQYGTVFKISPTGTYTVLHSFSYYDGVHPQAGLYVDSRGNLYGTTYSGGAHGDGTVFKIAPGGNYTVLHSFSAYVDGGALTASLTADSSGNLYGTSTYGGASIYGTVFKISPEG